MAETEKVESTELLIEEENHPIIYSDECAKLKPILQDFVQGFVQFKDQPVDEWLPEKLQKNLPETSPVEIKAMSDEIISSLQITEDKKVSLSRAIESGRSKDSWFAAEVERATSSMAPQQTVEYLRGLDTALDTANEKLRHTIMTQGGTVSQNPNLDGYIAEQYHAQTFNLNAEASGSPYRAEVLEPKPGEGYGKNSVDIVIRDTRTGKIVQRYQSKYCKDAASTEKAFGEGDYRGQRKLVPEGQKEGISKKSTDVLEAPDGTKSNPLPKKTAEQMRDEAQSGNWNDLNWNEYKTKDIAIGISKKAGCAALQGAAIGVGFDVAKKIFSGEEIKGEEVVETALKSGADFGVKAAAAGALKAGVEKGVISVIPKGTPAGTLANVAFVAIEDAKVMGKVCTGELSVREGLDQMERTTVSTAAGMIAAGMITSSKAFKMVGAALDTLFGQVGTAIGEFVGGTVGFIAGSKIGNAIVTGARAIRSAARTAAKAAWEGIKSVGRSIRNVFGRRRRARA